MDEDTKKTLDALSERMNAIEQAIANISTNMEEMGRDKGDIAEVVSSYKATRDAETTEAVNAVVEANLLTEAEAKATPLTALKALANSAKAAVVAPAPGVFGGFKPAANAAKVSLAEDWEK